MSITTTVGTTTAMAIFWCAVWLSGLVLDVGVDATLDSIQDINTKELDEERDEREGDDDKVTRLMMPEQGVV